MSRVVQTPVLRQDLHMLATLLQVAVSTHDTHMCTVEEISHAGGRIMAVISWDDGDANNTRIFLCGSQGARWRCVRAIACVQLCEIACMCDVRLRLRLCETAIACDCDRVRACMCDVRLRPRACVHVRRATACACDCLRLRSRATATATATACDCVRVCCAGSLSTRLPFSCVSERKP